MQRITQNREKKPISAPWTMLFTFTISVPIVWLRGRAKGFTNVEIKTNQDLTLNKGAEIFSKILLHNVSIAYNG